jgi:hypothetical protein
VTVSRRGKSGRRAGGKKTRPASRNNRVIKNSNLKALTKQFLPFQDKPKISKEEWVIQQAIIAVGKKGGFGFVQADDLVSDILLDLLNAGGFAWGRDEIQSFCKKRATWVVHKYLYRQEIAECEFGVSEPDYDGEVFSMENLGGSVPALQPLVVDCNTWRQRLKALPDKQRLALEILCDGGNPIDVAEELGVKPWEAITLIREGREWLHRVDPADEPW